MYRFILLFVLGCIAFPAFAQPADSTRKGFDEYREDGFVVVAFLISDSTFFERWERPEPPRITPDTRYIRGETAYPVLVFQSDAVDEAGNAHLTYDLTITKPDGSPFSGSPLRDLVAWENAPTPALSLGFTTVSLIIEEDDPLGAYGIEFEVRDENRGKTVPLSLSFVVTDE